MRKMRNGKAGGSYDLLVEVRKGLGERASAFLAELVHMISDSGKIP